MLSRLAESFFWMGRYLERAEATARMLGEHNQLLVEDRTVPDIEGIHALVDVLALDAASLAIIEAGGQRPFLKGVLGDAQHSSTVIGAVASARENARAVRDALPTDVYEALNTLHLSLIRGRLLSRGTSPGQELASVVERLVLVHGVAEVSMPRDEGYAFMSLGRYLERLDMMARLLEVRHDLLWPEAGPNVTLRSASALSAFLRTRNQLTGAGVRFYLVLDPLFPRSMRSAAAGAVDAVQMLGRMGTFDGTLQREVGIMSSSLEYAGEPDDETVMALATDTQQRASAAAYAAGQAFFRPVGTIVWSS
jgi:uncharacterized alpha-E superfamily protein